MPEIGNKKIEFTEQKIDVILKFHFS